MQAILKLGCWSMTVLGPGLWLKGKVQLVAHHRQAPRTEGCMMSPAAEIKVSQQELLALAIIRMRAPLKDRGCTRSGLP